MPKFAKYTLPGGENYREILLTLPSNRPSIKNMTRAEYNAAIDAADRAGVQDFRSGHWDQPNVLAHIRVNDRVDADGKKMLLVEEVQSDWHQAGRDRGYKPADIAQRIDEINEQMNALAKQRDPVTNRMTDEPKWFDLARERDALVKQSVQQVPDAPMKDTWYQLALKRVLKYAADNGYERVGLTTGARQAERYDLSKQVDAVMLEANGVLSGRIKGTAGWQQLATGVTENNVASYIGKEPAKRLLAEKPGIDGERELRGEALSVGGEGMKKYYDEVYPQFLAKYGKKWDAKMGETKINLQGDLEGFMPRKDMQVEPVRYIDITPQMRESVSKGQPLFTAVPAGTAAAGATMQDKEQK